MKSWFRSGLLLFTVSLFILEGCNVTRPLKQGEYLLVKNKLRISDKRISSDELTGYIQQTPNTKLFGLFRANIAFYNMGSRNPEKDTKFKKWLRTKVGTAPVILDTSLNSIAIKQMKLYLNNIGFFYSAVTDSVEYRRKKARVTYHVQASRPYTVRTFTYMISDPVLASYVFKDSSKCLIHRGGLYNTYVFDEERSRIAGNLKNFGYYKFSGDFIFYRVDSSLQSKQMDVILEITNPVVPSVTGFGMVEEVPHKRYYINRVEIIPDYDPIRNDSVPYDTLVTRFLTSKKDPDSAFYYFLSRDRMRIKPKTIAQCVFFKNGQIYNQKNVLQSYSQLSGLQQFSYTNIQFEESPLSSRAGRDRLDSRIYLSRLPANGFSVSTDGTNSAGAFGIEGSFTYMNRNLFRGGQIFRAGFTASAQMQGSVEDTKNNVLFNTIELGINVSLTFPQFLIPVRQEFLPKYFKPRTTILIGYNFQQRPDYHRHINNISFGYSWDQNEQIRHVLNPAEILLVKIFPDSSFVAEMNQQTDKRLKNQYTDHLIPGLKYTFTFSNQNLTKLKDFFYVRTNLDIAGNLLYAIDNLFKTQKNGEGKYTLFDIQYSQFVRPDVDFRYYHATGKNQRLVTRFYGGIGYAYGNSNVLPFEKAFFAGGANDIRGWQLGTLGPGSYHNDTVSATYDQTGDMQLQVNLEYRFPVAGVFRSAVFLDAGNVWLLEETQDYPGGKFEFSTFLNQVAVDVGLGIRLDFDFFIFRLDPAIPVRVPYYPAGNHWYFSKLQLADIIWNFGIGYPF